MSRVLLRRYGPWVAVVAALAVTVVLAVVLRPKDNIRAVPAAARTTVPDLTGSPFVSPVPVAEPAPHRAGGRTLVGAAYPADPAGLHEMRLNGVPFTFLTPEGWTCHATTSVAAWRCVEGPGAEAAVVDVVLRRCSGACSATDRALLDAGLPRATALTVVDSSTRYVQQTAAGRYVLGLDRVFRPVAGGPQWVVLARAETPADQAATGQRIVNDIYGQT
jgi:hypothetical protein